MGKLIIIYGLPFSGKTTLGKAIACRFGHDEVDVDDVKGEMFATSIDDNALSRSDWTRLYENADRIIEDLLHQGKTVLDASRNFRRNERELARKIAEKANALLVTIHVDTPENVVRERWLANRRSPTRRDIQDGDFENAIRAMEAPTPEETPLVFRPRDETEAWITRYETVLGA